LSPPRAPRRWQLAHRAFRAEWDRDGANNRTVAEPAAECARALGRLDHAQCAAHGRGLNAADITWTDASSPEAGEWTVGLHGCVLGGLLLPLDGRSQFDGWRLALDHLALLDPEDELTFLPCGPVLTDPSPEALRERLLTGAPLIRAQREAAEQLARRLLRRVPLLGEDFRAHADQEYLEALGESAAEVS
jgi:hypothetical protein